MAARRGPPHARRYLLLGRALGAATPTRRGPGAGCAEDGMMMGWGAARAVRQSHRRMGTCAKASRPGGRELGAGVVRKRIYRAARPWARKPGVADDEIVRRVEEVSKKRGWSMAEVALAWATAKTDSPITGVSSVSLSA